MDETGDEEQTTDEPEVTGARSLTRWPGLIPRPSKVQALALVLITLLSLGPVLALVLVIRSDASPVTTLAEEDGAPAGGAHLVVTAIAIDAAAGELRVRVLVRPDPADLRNGRLTTDLVLAVNDARGRSTVVLPAGQPISPAEFTLEMYDGSIRQFPFDTYRSVMVLVLSAQSGDQTEALPVTMELRTAVDGYAIEASLPTPGATVEPVVREATFDIARSTATIVYVLWIMVLMYGLAIAGVGLLWTVAIRRIEVPFWSYGLFVGVLFAIPPLRIALPGDPPLGVLVDYVSFYWSVTIVGIALLWLIAVGIRQHRLASQTTRSDGTD